jgi:hypothetical protein
MEPGSRSAPGRMINYLHRVNTMIEKRDDWEEPDEFWQVLGSGGFVVNMSKPDADSILDAIKRESKDLITIEDIYGDEAIILPWHVTFVRQWTKKGGERYKRAYASD